ncbi:MAG TPA: tyrosine-type recombinase/integrase, partial [Actinomycetes bacterium]|nr:tyrosine-type recombinase/integrase [Actinomycetes bacterium]
MIRRRNNGWQVMVYGGRDPLTGRKKWISRQVNASRREAERVERRLMTEVADGRHEGTQARTMAELLDQWIAWRAENGKDLSPKTLNDYRRLIQTKIKPGLGGLPVGKVDVRTLDTFYGRLRTAGNSRAKDGQLSGSRVRDVHVIISGALGLAARYRWIPFNPAVHARPAAGRSEQRSVPSPEQVRQVFEAVAEDPELELFLRIGVTAGLRPGEVCALRWMDLDLDGLELEVNGNIVNARGLPDGYVRKPPKSANGVRLLALDQGTVDLLARHRARRTAQVGDLGGELAPEAYLFSNHPDGAHPVRPDAMSRRFTDLARRLGHGYTLYGLRHFMATQLGAVAEAGTVRGRLGHGSLAVTSIYTHRV